MGNRKSCPMSRCADKPRPTQKLRSTKLVRRLFAVGILTFGVLFLLNVAYFAVSTTVAAEPSPAGRDLLSSGVEVVPGLDGTCGWETDSTGRAIGMTFLYICLNIWLFLGIAIICDGHFTASLEMICSDKGLNLNNDVAGATFMAAGSSAPELATSFVGTFLSDSNVGVGTIIGSAVFNILVIIGATAVLSEEPLELDWRPVVRDNFFYLISVIILICVIKIGGNDDIDIVDAIVLLIWYSCYIAYMAINETMIDKFCPHDSEEEECEPDAEQGEAAPSLKMGDDRSETPSDVNVSVSTPGAPKGSGGGATLDADIEMNPTAEGGGAKEKRKKSLPSHHANIWTKSAEEEEAEMDKEDGLATSDDSDEDEDGEEGSAFCQVVDKVNMVCSFPWEIIFNYTMPDCAYPFELIDSLEGKLEDKNYYIEHGKEEQAARKAAKEKQLKKLVERPLTCGQRWFWATFFVSLIHITWMSYFMVELMVKCGCILGISDTVMGLTFLAMGTSIPDALGSLAVAAKGEGDMAVSNAVGSNVFDICMGLGLPWFIKCAAGDGPIPIGDTDAIIPSILILVAIIVLLFSTFALSKWMLQPLVGYILLSAYGAFVIYSLVYESVK